MTNYEWLIHTNRLGEFLADFASSEVTSEDMSTMYGEITELSDRTYSEDIAAWLQAEHKEKICIDVEEVIDIVKSSLKEQTGITGTPLAVNCEMAIRDYVFTRRLENE